MQRRWSDRVRDFLLWEPRWQRRSREALENRVAVHRVRGLPGVTIEEFYHQDERRRRSREDPIDGPWLDARGRRYDVFWVADTKELYAMLTPAGIALPSDPEDGFPGGVFRGPLSNPMVSVIGVVEDPMQLNTLLPGWRAKVAAPGGYEWAVSRLSDRRPETPV